VNERTVDGGGEGGWNCGHGQDVQIADTCPKCAPGTLMMWNLHGLRNKGDTCLNITSDSTGNTDSKGMII
jgi:hypothetical protein